MLSIALSKDDVHEFLSSLNNHKRSFGLTVACENSPRNVTVAGEERLIDQLKRLLDQKEIFSRKLRVPVAYHSSQMQTCAAKYESLIGKLNSASKDNAQRHIRMVSSVTGYGVDTQELLKASYWSRNLTSTVRFSEALSKICANSTTSNALDVNGLAVQHLIEVGPHSALQGPIREILAQTDVEKTIGYSSVLKRFQSAETTALDLVGQMFCKGVQINWNRVNIPDEGTSTEPRPAMLTDLPFYPFDHSRSHWHESRISRNFRFRSEPPSELIGVRCNDWTRFESKWRHFLKTSELPWCLDHTIDGNTIYPAAGMLVMAIEAVRKSHQVSEQISGFLFQDIALLSAIDLTLNQGCVEVETTLRAKNHSSENDSSFSYKFNISSYSHSKSDWTVNCQGTITAEVVVSLNDWSKATTQAQMRSMAKSYSTTMLSQSSICVDANRVYNTLKDCGLDFGPAFQVAKNQRFNMSQDQASADIALLDTTGSGAVIHPVSLDATFHLALTSLTSGGNRKIAATVPTRIKSLWLSGKAGFVSSNAKSLKAYTKIDNINSRGFTTTGIAVGATDCNTLMWYNGLTMTNISSPLLQNGPDKKQQVYMRLHCKPDLAVLETQEICCLLESLHPPTVEDLCLWGKLRLIVDSSLLDLFNFIDNTPVTLGHDQSRNWRAHYLHWARHHINKYQQTNCKQDMMPGELGSSPGWKEMADNIRGTNHTANLIVTVAISLESLFTEVATPLEVLLQSGVLKRYYEELNMHTITSQISSYIELLCHQRPGSVILEVGGGTGGGTRNFLRALSRDQSGDDRSRDKRLLHCKRYDFTDVSPTLVDCARVEFGHLHQQMTFGLLDIEKDYASQGYPDSQYDILLAVQVLHITTDLEACLRRARKSLKVGGKLILQESLNPSGGILSFIFGLFPGWWLGREDGRELSPSVSLDTWDSLLKRSGFSGVEIVRDFGQDINYHVGWVVSTAVEFQSHKHERITQEAKVITVNTVSKTSGALVAKLCDSVALNFGFKTRVQTLPISSTAQPQLPQQRNLDDNVFILLVDNDDICPLLTNLGTWQQVRNLLQRYSKIMWISFGGKDSAYPAHGIIDGLFRTLRHEEPSQHLIAVALESADPTSTHISGLSKVIKMMTDWNQGAQYEQEYISVNGIFHTRRLVEAIDIHDRIERVLSNNQTFAAVPCDGKTPFALAQGSLDDPLKRSLHYVEVEPSYQLHDDRVEILVKGAALKVQEGTGMWSCFSGIVQNTGPNALLKKGDRVFVMSSPPGDARSHMSISSTSAIHIDNEVSFEMACMSMPTLVIAHHAVCELGQFPLGATFLVQESNTQMSQAVLQVLVDHNVPPGRIWTTATNEEEASKVSAAFQIPSDHIFPQHWLDDGIILTSQWRAKFDIAFITATLRTANILSAINAYGHVIAIQASPAQLFDRAKMSNMSWSILKSENFIPSRASLSYAAINCQKTLLKPMNSCKAFPGSSIEDALKVTKGLGNQTAILTFDSTTILQLQKPHELVVNNYQLLRTSATYIIAGGLGGLGRALSKWLVQRGARFLILISRSGPRTPTALELLSQLRKKGVVVETPRCDISDGTSVKNLITSYSKRLPPIAGCIQASMVLKVSVSMPSEERDVRLMF